MNYPQCGWAFQWVPFTKTRLLPWFGCVFVSFSWEFSRCHCIYPKWYSTTYFPTHQRTKMKLIVSNEQRKCENKLLGWRKGGSPNRMRNKKTKFVLYNVKSSSYLLAIALAFAFDFALYWAKHGSERAHDRERKSSTKIRTNLLITFLFKILYSLLAIIKRWVSMSLKFIMNE